MNLYLLTQNTNIGYDNYDSCIVAAKNEQEAKAITPTNDDIYDQEYQSIIYCDWVKSVDDVQCTKIGTAIKGTPKGVILASFNAG